MASVADVFSDLTEVFNAASLSLLSNDDSAPVTNDTFERRPDTKPLAVFAAELTIPVPIPETILPTLGKDCAAAVFAVAVNPETDFVADPNREFFTDDRIPVEESFDVIESVEGFPVSVTNGLYEPTSGG